MKTLNARPFVALAAGREWSAVPTWDGVHFKAHGKALLLAIHRVSAATRARFGNVIAMKAKAHLARFVHAVARKTTMKAAADLNDLWDEAVSQVLKELSGDILRQIEPEVRSVMGQGWSKTRLLLGQQTVPLPGGDDLAHGVIEQSASIDETTADRVRNAARAGIDKGLAGRELATQVEIAMDMQSSGRARTIGRTVAQSAWNAGTTAAMKRHGEVTHVSVIGCTSREEGSWSKPWYRDFMWPPEGEEGDGRSPESTCNIEDVPVEFSDQLNFHPNHTGTIVPSGWS